MPEQRMAPEERRAHLRECAIRCFSDGGYHATSVAEIVKAAGVAQGTFYNYFDSKRAIFDDLLDALLAEIQAAARPVRLGDGEPDPLVQLRENTARVLEILLARADLAKLLLSEAVGLDAEADAKLQGFYGALLALIERALSWGHKLGISRGGNFAIQARMVLGTVKETVFGLVINGAPEVAPGLVDELLAFNLRGLVSPSARESLE